jgi:O-antigen/teichoic acid export membrane protein
MMVHKISNVLVNNTDHLLLSSLVGTLAVGCYSNYYLVIRSVRQVLDQMFQGMTASIGNMNVSESKDKISNIYDSIFFMGQWVYGLITIMLYEVLDTFIALSFGKQYRFEGNVTLVLCLVFYFSGMRQPTLIFRDSMGLFKYDKAKSVAEAVINLAVSIILGYKYGITGVFLGTLISLLLTSVWVEPYMFYKHRLGRSSMPFFGRYAFYAVITFAILIIEHSLIASYVPVGDGWISIIVKLIITFIVTNLFYLGLYFRNGNFIFLKHKIAEVLEKRFME